MWRKAKNHFKLYNLNKLHISHIVISKNRFLSHFNFDRTKVTICTISLQNLYPKINHNDLTGVEVTKTF